MENEEIKENEENKKEYKICCVTGHRPKGFFWDYKNKNDEQHQKYLYALRARVEDLITHYGINYFITGCAAGADLDFAEACIELRDTKYPHIIIEGAIPCDKQDARWSAENKERYAKVLEKLNVVHYVSHAFNMGCFQKRNEYMVDKSDIVLAIWNCKKEGGTWNTIHYAEQNNKYIDYFFLGFFAKSLKAQEDAFLVLVKYFANEGDRGDDKEKKGLFWRQFEQRLKDEGLY